MSRMDEKVLPEDHDSTVSQLLIHLKTMRESVPVNYQLKQDLKQRLLAQMGQIGNSPVPMGAKKKKGWIWWVAPTVLLLCLIGWLVGGKDMIDIEHVKEIHPHGIQAVTGGDISGDGKKIVLLSDNKLFVYNNKGEKMNAIDPPKDMQLADLDIGPGDQVAVTANNQQESSVWIIDLMNGGSRLVWKEPKANFSKIKWSAQGSSVYVDNQGEIWKVSTISSDRTKLAKGAQPSPSPDEKHLAVADQQNISIISILSGSGKMIPIVEQAHHPEWIGPRVILFVDKEQTVKYAEVADSDKGEATISASKIKGVDKIECSSNGKWALIFPSGSGHELSLFLAEIKVN